MSRFICNEQLSRGWGKWFVKSDSQKKSLPTLYILRVTATPLAVVG